MTVLLGGGGDADAERPVLDRFAELTDGGEVTYWPMALDLSDYGAATEFVEKALGRPVSTCHDLEDEPLDDLGAVSGVFIGGGNTYHLLSAIRRSGIDGPLRTFAESRVVYGGSAGAIVLGADVDTAASTDANEVGITDTTGLCLIGHYAVWCHFDSDHLDRVAQWVQGHRRPVIALSERSGAEVDRGVLTAIGLEPLRVVNAAGESLSLEPGEQLPLDR